MNRLLVTTALIAIAPTAYAQDVSYRQLTQLATISTGNERVAFSFAPEYSDTRGLSARAAFGMASGEAAAIGFVLQAGPNVREGLLNVGIKLNDSTSVVLSGGQLRERLSFGESGDREWIKQDEYGIALNSERYAFNIYSVSSGSTDNFIGAKSYGAEIEANRDISEVATLSGSLGYQRIDENDGSAAEQSLTGSVDLGIQVNGKTRGNLFADYNLTETQYGVGLDWKVGKGSVGLDYAYIARPAGYGLSDDQRIALTMSLPLGRSAPVKGAGESRTDTTSTDTSISSSLLLAEVIRRPEYLPTSVIAKASGSISSACSNLDTAELTDYIRDYIAPWPQKPAMYDSGSGLLYVDGLLDVGSYRAVVYDYLDYGADDQDITIVGSKVIGPIDQARQLDEIEIPSSSQTWMENNFGSYASYSVYSAVIFVEDNAECSVDATGEQFFRYYVVNN
jgi:hypothetical protein